MMVMMMMMMMLANIIATDHGGILLLLKSEIKIAMAIAKSMIDDADDKNMEFLDNLTT